MASVRKPRVLGVRGSRGAATLTSPESSNKISSFVESLMAETPVDALQSSIPQLSSDDLNIESWERMDHGGHSFVFKVSIDSKVSVIKIFRFQAHGPPTHIGKPTSYPDPYIYFNRESASYHRLFTANLTGILTPHIHGILNISPTHESHLLSEGKLKGLNIVVRKSRKKKYGDMPLKAVWMELISGRRLAMNDIMSETGRELRRGVEGALGRIHEAGVMQGDVKWRNIMVLENKEDKKQEDISEKRIIWLDFSNAITVEDKHSKEVWETKLEEEMNRLAEMLTRHEPFPAAFEFEALGIS